VNSLNKKILVYSAGRTGSTLVWQCLRELFSEVKKIHPREMVDFLSDSIDCVIVERDPVPSFLSYVRCEAFKGDVKEFLKAIDNMDLDPAWWAETLTRYRALLYCVAYVKKNYKGRILLLDYNKFNNNYEYLFTQFENFFNISIGESDREKIIKKTNRDHNAKIQSNLTDFESWDSDSQIHGHHIASDSEEDYNFLGLEPQKILNEFLKREFSIDTYPIPPENGEMGA
jgi:hypothetical protein